MAILDPGLIGEFAGVIATAMQSVKAHPKVRGSLIPFLSGVVGLGVGVGWYAVSGDLYHHGIVDWANGFRGVCNGVAGAVTANAGYNLQKVLPIPNLLPTASEMDASKLKEAAATQQMVVDAVQQGVPPTEAKAAVGLDPAADPPPVADLAAMAPDPAQLAAPPAAPTPTPSPAPAAPPADPPTPPQSSPSAVAAPAKGSIG